MQLLEKEIATLSEIGMTLRREKQQVIDQKNEELQAARKELRFVLDLRVTEELVKTPSMFMLFSFAL